MFPVCATYGKPCPFTSHSSVLLTLAPMGTFKYLLAVSAPRIKVETFSFPKLSGGMGFLDLVRYTQAIARILDW